MLAICGMEKGGALTFRHDEVMLAPVRTMVQLEPDVERLLEEAARSDGKSFSEVINETLRESLAGKARAGGARYVLRRRHLGKALVDLTCTAQVLEELDTEAYLEKEACLAAPGRSA